MSLATWTPSALASEARRFAADAWRLVEAQHVASTSKLLSDPAEQALLEQMLEDSKPPLPADAAGLDYLLTTPWRYRPGRGGSRFRAEHDPGVWYGAEDLACAAAEIGYWRCRFIRDSAGLERLDPLPYTAYRAALATRAVDLRRPPLAAGAKYWTDPDSYLATQALAGPIREAGIGAIVYASVRDPRRPPAWCVALLSLAGFARPRPYPDTQTWFLTATAHSASWQRSVGGDRFAFDWANAPFE
jgi:hypothetical protein